MSAVPQLWMSVATVATVLALIGNGATAWPAAVRTASQQQPSSLTDRVLLAFEAADHNSDWFLSAAEFPVAEDLLPEFDGTTLTTWRLLARADVDGDGAINFRELLSAVEGVTHAGAEQIRLRRDLDPQASAASSTEGLGSSTQDPTTTEDPTTTGNPTTTENPTTTGNPITTIDEISASEEEETTWQVEPETTVQPGISTMEASTTFLASTDEGTSEPVYEEDRCTCSWTSGGKKFS